MPDPKVRRWEFAFTLLTLGSGVSSLIFLRVGHSAIAGGLFFGLLTVVLFQLWIWLKILAATTQAFQPEAKWEAGRRVLLFRVDR
jgi:hypothetical protein